MMWYLVLLLAGIAVAANGGRSPNADLVEKLFPANTGARYSNNILEDARLDVPNLVRKYKYPVQEHNVVTLDGYLVRAHRIPHGRGGPSSTPRIPVLLMHGLMCSSADFLVLGPGNALGYLLADAGYDVWLANARGNFYSRRHLFLDPNDREQLDFWKFSWDEIGNHDLPALVNRITAVTGAQKMHYIGYSQGTTTFLVLNSLRPQFNQRFISFQALAPAAFSEHNENNIRDLMVQFEAVLDRIAFRLGFVELMPRSDELTEIGIRFCSDGTLLQPLCMAMILGSQNVEYFNKTMLPLILGHNPAGAGVRQIIHYSQVQRFKRFARFNFGAIENLLRYGSMTPPAYNISRVTVPTVLHYSLGDTQADTRDVLLLAKRLRNTPIMHQIRRKTFNHFDFIWGGDAKAQLYDEIIANMKSMERS